MGSKEQNIEKMGIQTMLEAKANQQGNCQAEGQGQHHGE